MSKRKQTHAHIHFLQNQKPTSINSNIDFALIVNIWNDSNEFSCRREMKMECNIFSHQLLMLQTKNLFLINLLTLQFQLYIEDREPNDREEKKWKEEKRQVHWHNIAWENQMIQNVQVENLNCSQMDKNSNEKKPDEIVRDCETNWVSWMKAIEKKATWKKPAPTESRHSTSRHRVKSSSWILECEAVTVATVTAANSRIK